MRITMSLLRALTVILLSTNSLCRSFMLPDKSSLIVNDKSFVFLNASKGSLDIRKLKLVTANLIKPQLSDLNDAAQKFTAHLNKQFLAFEKPGKYAKAMRKVKGNLINKLNSKRKDRDNEGEFEMPNNIQHRKFSVRKNRYVTKALGPKASEKIKHWLYELSHCKVRYRWTNLGINIYPRYILRGTCSKKKTCSYPPGMRCVESEREAVLVYLFTCGNLRKKCKWLPLNVDVLTKCDCKCVKS